MSPRSSPVKMFSWLPLSMLCDKGRVLVTVVVTVFLWFDRVPSSALDRALLLPVRFWILADHLRLELPGEVELSGRRVGKNAWTRGRRVARLAAVTPMPTSTVLHRAMYVDVYKNSGDLSVLVLFQSERSSPYLLCMFRAA